ncbi:PadR family transcriptional regulator [Sphingomonas segetis]|uniref:PadR family transcriptional regulator n=1 Tax=Sphingomonas segetis TaxID=1104779 RepID=UPI001E3FE94D|nr:PadR family transcriptional regulator [Sphingomonas segetis]
MPHHRHHRHDPPEPPIPPIPPIPPMGCDESGAFGFGDFARMFGMGPRGWRGNWGPFHFDFGDEGWSGGRGGHRRGRRARRMFEGGELRLVLLKLIADEPRHGYDLIRAIEELTGGEYAPSPGVVYPTLTLLQDMGLIEEAAGEGPRKPFQVTDEGRAHLEERADEVEALIERLADLKPHRSEAGPAIGRAVRNLMTALTHRVGRDGLDDDLLHEIAAILDEAAQRIERVK